MLDRRQTPIDKLGVRVRQLRLALGLSQQELAQRARVTQPRISQIERGDGGTLPRRTLVDLADALGMSLAALVKDNPAYDWLDLDADVPTGGLPAGLPPIDAPLLGREDDLATLHALLISETPRLVTLTGPGGVGKTHLALRAARDAAGAFDAVIIVALASCDDAGHASSAIAHAAGVRDRDARPIWERLTTRLATSRCLLLLDNVEQALPSIAPFIADLLAACPRLTCLATSRISLQIRGERLHLVQPLALPELGSGGTVAEIAASPAVQLFLQRANAVAPRLELTADNADDVASVVRRLDGMPLAIELAATHARHYPPATMLHRLEAQFAFLANGPRDLPSRQQSLRTAIDWSFDLLSEEERALFRRLAVFRGGFTTEAAEAVAGSTARSSHRGDAAGTIPDLLASLAEWNLLTQVAHERDVRWNMLETIHDYARLQSAATEDVMALHHRHLAWIHLFVETCTAHFYSASEPLWLEKLRQEDANIEQALTWALGEGRATDLETGLRLAGALADYWLIDGQLAQARAWFDRALAACDERVPSIGQARALIGACLIEQTQADMEPAARHGAAGLAMAQALADRPTMGRGMLLLGNLAMMRQEYELARSLHAQAKTVFRDTGDRAWEALALLDLGMDCQRQGDLEQAAQYADASLDINQAIGNRWDVIPTLRLLADVARDQGDLDRAEALLRDSLTLAWNEQSEREAADSLSGLGVVAVHDEKWDLAARYLGAAETLYHRFSIRFPPPQRPDWAHALAQLHDATGHAECAQPGRNGAPEELISELVNGRSAHHWDLG